jgi:hypothetical protein
MRSGSFAAYSDKIEKEYNSKPGHKATLYRFQPGRPARIL